MAVRRLLAVAVSVTALVTGAAPAYAGHHEDRFPDRIELPNGWQPEGITIKGTTAYFGSRADGDIYAADLRTGQGQVISQGPGTASVGLKIAGNGLLFVAGGGAGSGRVVDSRTGAVVTSYNFTAAPTFVNDVVLTPDAAWFTESQRAQLYKVSIDKHGRPASTFSTVPLTGDYQHVPGVTNANGIVRTPDGRGLIIVQSSTGFLFRVDPATGATTKVDLGGALMTNGDGLLVIGKTLYVVQNRLNKIAIVAVNDAGTSGKLLGAISSPDFDVPTTVAAFGDRLYLPNARFTTPPTPDTPYWVTAVPRFFPNRIELPNGWQPEGIAIRHTTAYSGSLADGDIYAADLRTGRGRVISQGPGTPSVGLKISNDGLLFVAGGPAGSGRVVDSRTGAVVKTYQFTTSASFVNDVVLTPDAAWFTDSSQPQLYRVALDKHGRPGGFSTVPLSGDYQHQPGFNANGITRTPDGRGLIIVQSATATLFRVDPRTGVTKAVDLGGTPMTNGDGLLTIGRTLYVVQNQLNQIAVVKLNSSGTAGEIERTITSTDFSVPTTAAAFGDRLYLVNARFGTPPTPDTPYWITAVRR